MNGFDDSKNWPLREIAEDDAGELEPNSWVVNNTAFISGGKTTIREGTQPIVTHKRVGESVKDDNYYSTKSKKKGVKVDSEGENLPDKLKKYTAVCNGLVEGTIDFWRNAKTKIDTDHVGKVKKNSFGEDVVFDCYSKVVPKSAGHPYPDAATQQILPGTSKLSHSDENQFKFLKPFDPSGIPKSFDFVENQCYNTGAKHKGIAVIVNVINSSSDKDLRTAYENDIQILNQVLIDRKFVVHNLVGADESQLVGAIKECQNLDFSNADSFLFVLINHDEKETMSNSTVGEGVSIWNYIPMQFNNRNCKGMRGKPKIFIFDLRSGTDRYDPTLLENKINPVVISTLIDTIVWCAVDIDNIFNRDKKQGSGFIRTICDVLRVTAGETTDLFKLVNIVTQVMKSMKMEKVICSLSNFGFTKKFSL